MAQFKPGVPVTTTTPTVTVDPPLAAGKHLFRLVVVDDKGQQSDPAEQAIIVRPPVIL
jgi:hypothetical protein